MSDVSKSNPLPRGKSGNGSGSGPASSARERANARSAGSFGGTFKQPKSFSRADDVLNGLMSHLGLDKRLREHTLMNLWPTLISQFFSDRSRALFIDNEGTLVIAVKDASCGQELTLLQPQLLPKLKTLAANLNLTVKNLRFELKHFHQTTSNQNFPLETVPQLPEASNDELFALELKIEDKEKIELLKADLTDADSSKKQLNSETAAKIIFLFEKQLRLAQWRKAHNYPLCTRCQEAASMLHGNDLCEICYLDSIVNC